MCGIVGVISSKILSKTHEEIFEDMLVMDTVRGKDSVGVFVHDVDDVLIAKSTMPAHEFISSRIYRAALGTSAQCIIGHNRAATTGSVRVRNAHPFEQGDITLVHNGTLRGHNKATAMFEVDSESIAYALNQAAAQEQDVVRVLEELKGAYALVWYDKRINCIRVARNDERELTYVKSTDGSVFFISSEPHILAAAANRNNFEVDVSKHSVDFKAGVLYTFDLDSIGALSVTEVAFEPKKSFTKIVYGAMTPSKNTTNNSTGTGSGKTHGSPNCMAAKLNYRVHLPIGSTLFRDGSGAYTMYPIDGVTYKVVLSGFDELNFAPAIENGVVINPINIYVRPAVAFNGVVTFPISSAAYMNKRAGHEHYTSIFHTKKGEPLVQLPKTEKCLCCWGDFAPTDLDPDITSDTFGFCPECKTSVNAM